MIREAIILAGGLGTRLRDTVPDLPKCMAPVAGRPFLHYILAHYRQKGINHFIFSLGYLSHIVLDFLDQQPDLRYSAVTEETPLGTGGAVRLAAGMAKENHSLVLNGDTFFDVDVAQLSEFHTRSQSQCTLALKPMNQTDRYGVVEKNEKGQISSFLEKGYYESSVINGGVYALDLNMFGAISFPEKFSFEKDYLEVYCRQGLIYGMEQQGYFIDIGVPQDYQKAQEDFINKT